MEFTTAFLILIVIACVCGFICRDNPNKPNTSTASNKCNHDWIPTRTKGYLVSFDQTGVRLPYSIIYKQRVCVLCGELYDHAKRQCMSGTYHEITKEQFDEYQKQDSEKFWEELHREVDSENHKNFMSKVERAETILKEKQNENL